MGLSSEEFYDSTIFFFFLSIHQHLTIATYEYLFEMSTNNLLDTSLNMGFDFSLVGPTWFLRGPNIKI